MSLTVNSGSSTNFEPVSEGVHIAVCNMLIDLGMQYSEYYKTSSRQVMIGWEIPDETMELDDGPVPRQITQKYTASLNQKSTLRNVLESWRGKKFTDKELAGFDLRNIVGKTCQISVTHTVMQNGKVYAGVGAVMALPKGVAPVQLSSPPTVYDIDANPLEAVDDLPAWIAEQIKKSTSYQEKLTAGPKMEDLNDEGDLPF